MSFHANMSSAIPLIFVLSFLPPRLERYCCWLGGQAVGQSGRHQCRYLNVDLYLTFLTFQRRSWSNGVNMQHLLNVITPLNLLTSYCNIIRSKVFHINILTKFDMLTFMTFLNFQSTPSQLALLLSVYYILFS